MKRWRIIHRLPDGTLNETGLRYFFKRNADAVCKHLNILALLSQPPRDIFTEALMPYKKPCVVVSGKTPLNVL